MNPFASARPILSALRSHRSAALLLALEIALTLAVLCNLVFIVTGTLQRAGTATGIAEADIGVIQSIGVIGTENSGTTNGSLAALLQVPGVEAAAFGSVPFWSSTLPLFHEPSGTQAPAAQPWLFFGSQGLSRTLGVRVAEGRDLQPDDLPSIQTIIDGEGELHVPALVTRALAERLFPGRPALGEQVYGNVYGAPARFQVVGVIDRLRGEISGRRSDDEALVAELRTDEQSIGGLYLVRSHPGQLQEVLPLATRAMHEQNPGHVQQQVVSVAELRERAFQGDRAIARILVAIMAILLLVTALGIGGLASFWVAQRTPQIGVRRALGATRSDILRYFQVENFMIVTGGAAGGALLAYVLNGFLMQRFELDRLPPGYVVIALVALWVLGQLAVLGPALRAAAIPPATATRSA